MSQTVIGFFDNASEAQRAVDQLQSRGIGRDRIDVSHTSPGTAGTDRVSTTSRDHNTVGATRDERTVDRKGRNTNRITDFFNSLFQGGDTEEVPRFSRVAERAEAIVTVHAQSKDEAERAADILDDAGAFDVDERASQYGFTHTRSTGDVGERHNTAAGGQRQRSRIYERRIEDRYRLRDEDSDPMDSGRRPLND
jgi:hypothetical protein